MKTLLGREAWPLLKISDELLRMLRDMAASGSTPDQMITYLHDQDVPKPGAILALRLSGVMPSRDTKQAVHCHPAYTFRRQADEAFQESLLSSLGQIERSEAA